VQKFSPDKLFYSVVNLVSTNQGYTKTLIAAWSAFGRLISTPFKSAFSKKRERISHTFFEEEYEKLIAKYEPNRRQWRGLRIYGTDGDQYDLPATEDILNAGYKGFPCANNMETYYPKMYVVQCVDLLSGVTKKFLYGNQNRETELALEIAICLESNSLTLYDRLFFSRDLTTAHASSKSYYFARCRKGLSVLSEIQAFEHSSLGMEQIELGGNLVTLIKIKNPTNDEIGIFATNLPDSFLMPKIINELYALRWGVETSNRDITHTLEIEKWHSKSINGIQQEIFALLWVMNQAKIQMAYATLDKAPVSPERREYAVSNFKAVMDFLREDLLLYVKNKSKGLMRKMSLIIQQTKENRKRLSRSYPREVKRAGKTHKINSMVPRR
jgi:hypothetical protein